MRCFNPDAHRQLRCDGVLSVRPSALSVCLSVSACYLSVCPFSQSICQSFCPFCPFVFIFSQSVSVRCLCDAVCLSLYMCVSVYPSLSMCRSLLGSNNILSAIYCKAMSALYSNMQQWKQHTAIYSVICYCSKTSSIVCYCAIGTCSCTHKSWW